MTTDTTGRQSGLLRTPRLSKTTTKLRAGDTLSTPETKFSCYAVEDSQRRNHHCGPSCSWLAAPFNRLPLGEAVCP